MYVCTLNPEGQDIWSPGISAARRCGESPYTRSPLEDSRLFRPSPWKILAATNEKDISEQPSPW